MNTIILFILVLGLLVFVHEFGHFIAARKTGMKVHEFALGFPPLLIGVYKDPKTKKFVFVGPRTHKKNVVSAGTSTAKQMYPATLYSLNLLPLGGFCQIKGENGEEAVEPDSFGYQKTWKKVITLVAGVVMNFLLAAVLLGVGFGIGLPTDITGGFDDPQAIVSAPEVVVQEVQEGSPADLAGMMPGFSLKEIDGVAVEGSASVIAAIEAANGNAQAFTGVFGDKGKQFTFAAELQDGTPKIGVILADAATVRYPWHIALWKGLKAAWINLIGIFVGFYILLKELILGNGLAFEVAGPVGIAAIIGDSARMGIQYLINVTAMISLSLAAINILPIPALDGGRLLFVLIEKVTGKPVPLKYEQTAHTIGFILLLALILIITVRDITGLL